MRRFSVEGKVALVAGLAVLAAAVLGWLMLRLVQPAWLALLFTVALSVPATVLAMHRLLVPINRLFQALLDGVSSLRDNDFSVSIATRRQDELGDLVRAYNELGNILRRERQSLFQRELLLDTVIQTTPLALVLANVNDRIVYSNTAARRLFAGGRPLNGFRFTDILADANPAFRQAVEANHDGLFTVGSDDEPQTFHLSFSHFTLNTQPHNLYLFKQLTHELSRREVATWKKVIRVISHELNNSLAPISSLAHSGGLIASDPDPQKLDAIFSTIEERANHLKVFIEGYARFARLPAPRAQSVDWEPFIGGMQQTVSFGLVGGLPGEPSYFDAGQMEQVLINLIKNAHESGSPGDAVELAVAIGSGQLKLEVRDRGAGMSDRVLKNALLPFYSTKQTGTGLGLPLCREIVEAHGGRLSLGNREGGGLVVRIWLPEQPVPLQAEKALAP